MNKSQLVEKIAVAADISKKDAAASLAALLDTVCTELKASGDVALVGFGSFGVRSRAARQGRNPRTGEATQIAAANVPSFKPGKALKDSVNS